MTQDAEVLNQSVAWILTQVEEALAVRISTQAWHTTKRRLIAV